MTQAQAPTKDPDNTSTKTAAPRAPVATRPPNPRRSSGWAAWVGIAAALAMAIGLVIAVVAGSGTDGPVPVNVDELGSDVHLHNLADDLANRQALVHPNDTHLHNLANDIANRQTPIHPNDTHLHNLANDIADR